MRRSDKRRCSGLTFRVPDDVWARKIKDPVREYPAYRLELSWVAEDVLHFATVTGFCTDDELTEANGKVVDDRWADLQVADHWCADLHGVAVITVDLSANSGTVTLVNGDVHDDWPVLLINQHYH
jgi:hypothetical protein